ncbi:MAG: aldo/keto reductase [Eubacteriales bacterium]|nr:aldo/keto reductase [Eubacteriales bacterium]
MKYATIKGTDLKPSAICLGGGPLGATLGQEESFALLDAFYEAGGNFIDTAKIYSDWRPGERSVSEKTIGRWMKARGNRNNLVVTTKGAHTEMQGNKIIRGSMRLSEKDITYDLESSLQSLQVNCIDLYWLHRDDEKRPVSEILGTLDAHVKKGHIRYYGCSNWKPERILEALAFSRVNGTGCFVANQMMWSLAMPQKELMEDYTLVLMDSGGLKMHTETGMAAIPYSSQAKGLLTKMSDTDKGTDILSSKAFKTYDTDLNRQKHGRAEKLSDELGISINQIVLAYLISHPFSVIPIAGCKNVIQMNESIKALEFRLDSSAIAYLEKGT